MAIFSRLRELSLPYNCYEVGHTWTPNCSEAALLIGYVCLTEGMKIYAPLYLISQFIQRKFSLKAFLSTLENTYTSSCFLGFNGFAFIFIFCTFRKLMGKFYYLHCSYLPAFLASFLAILIEKRNRRGPLALYVTNVASETVFRMAVSRGKIKPIPGGEVYLFSVTMAFFLYIIRCRGFTRDFISIGLKYIVGKDEAKPPKRRKGDKTKENENVEQGKLININLPKLKRLPIIAKIPSPKFLSVSQQSFFGRILAVLKKYWNETKHGSCPHSCSCPDYAFKGFLQPFVLGYATYALIRCLTRGKKLLTDPLMLFKLLKQRQTLNLGLFLGGFAGTFRLLNCVCRWIFGKDRDIYAFPAALVGGLFMKFFPSSTLALYLMWKLIEISYLLGIEEGVLPKVRGSMLVLYASSTAILFYAAVLEPHNLKPAYFKFLNRITQNKIGQINRHVLDIFGTHASKLYGNYWPEVDLRYTSRVFQESVLMWLIH